MNKHRLHMLFIRLFIYWILRLPVILTLPYFWFYGLYDFVATVILIFIDKIIE